MGLYCGLWLLFFIVLLNKKMTKMMPMLKMLLYLNKVYTNIGCTGGVMIVCLECEIGVISLNSIKFVILTFS